MRTNTAGVEFFVDLAKAEEDEALKRPLLRALKQMREVGRG